MPKKMVSTEEQVAQAMLDEADATARQIAADEGPPPGASKLSQADEDRLYGLKDLSVDPDQIFTSLMNGGLHPEQAAQLQVVRENPDLAKAFTEGAPSEEMAHALASLAEYPFRLKLATDGLPEPSQQVDRAATLKRRFLKGHADRLEAQQAGEDFKHPHTGTTVTPEPAPMAPTPVTGATQPVPMPVTSAVPPAPLAAAPGPLRSAPPLPPPPGPAPPSLMGG